MVAKKIKPIKFASTAAGNKTFKDKVIAFITKPAKAFEAEDKTDIGNAIVYGLFGLLIRGFLTAILITLALSVFGLTIGNIFGLGALGSIAGGGLGIVAAVIVFIVSVIGGFIGLLISGLWFHLWAYVMGARNGLGQTMKTVFYANTPDYILGWIPFISVATNIWSLVLAGLGLTKLQKLTAGKAAVAVIIAIAIPLGLWMLLAGSLNLQSLG